MAAVWSKEEKTKPGIIFPIPLHDAQKSGTERRTKKGGGVDAEELSRLLNKHLERQAIKSEQRRAAKAAKAAAAPYIPRVAASAHHRTTTPDAMRQIHKMSQPVYKQHSEVLHVDIPGLPLMDLQRTKLWDQAIEERNTVRNRNQWQWDQAMEKAAEVDMEREVNKIPQRTFPEFAHLINNKNRNEQPLKERDVFWDNKPLQCSKVRSKTAFEGRNDWVQKEDTEEVNKRAPLERAGLPSRKQDSIWLMRRKEKLVVVEAAAEAENCGKGRSFLARFNRH